MSKLLDLESSFIYIFYIKECSKCRTLAFSFHFNKYHTIQQNLPNYKDLTSDQLAKTDSFHWLEVSFENRNYARSEIRTFYLNHYPITKKKIKKSTCEFKNLDFLYPFKYLIISTPFRPSLYSASESTGHFKGEHVFSIICME